MLRVPHLSALITRALHVFTSTLENECTILLCYTKVVFFYRKNSIPTSPVPVQNSRLQKQTNSDLVVRIPTQNLLEEPASPAEQPRVSLDSIITEYLTNQHALCKNPMANCPKFNLFV